MKLIAVVCHPFSRHLLFKSNRVDNNRYGIIGTAFDRVYDVIRQDHRYGVLAHRIFPFESAILHKRPIHDVKPDRREVSLRTY